MFEKLIEYLKRNCKLFEKPSDDSLYGNLVDAFSCKFDDAYFVDYFHITNDEGNDEVLLVFLDTNYTANHHPRFMLENYNTHISIALDRPIYYKFDEYQDILPESDLPRFNEFVRRYVNPENRESCIWDICATHHLMMFEEDKTHIKWMGIPDYRKLVGEDNYEVLHNNERLYIHGTRVD